MEEKKFYEEEDFKDDLEKLKNATERLEKLAKLQEKIDEDMAR